jgi:hypothetical protein
MVRLPIRVALAGVVVALVAYKTCGAQDLSGLGATHVYGPPANQVLAFPTDAEVMAAWPPAAKAKDLDGSAVAHCVAAQSGELTNCQIMLERSHAGFGQALLSLIPKYRLRPAPAGAPTKVSDVVISATWPAPQTPVTWLDEPKDGDFMTSMTNAAWRAGGQGRAVMNCMAAKLGALHDCVVIYQDPAGKGFGTMALRFQSALRLKPATVGGKPIVSGLDIDFHFRPMRPGETR